MIRSLQVCNVEWFSAGTALTVAINVDKQRKNQEL